MKQLATLFLVALIAGCQSPYPPEPESTVGDSEAAVSSGIDGVYSGGSYNPGQASGYNPASNGDYYQNPEYGKNVTAGPRSQAKDRVIYFSYDSANIDKRAEAIVKKHAAYLTSHKSAKILLEGHTDSRGSREYNIALGERRAVSVLKYFRQLGVNASQIRIISYGEEKPAVDGFNESAYRRNRRAVIQY